MQGRVSQVIVSGMIDEDLKNKINELEPADLEMLRRHVSVLQRIKDPQYKAEITRLRKDVDKSDLVSVDEFADLVKSS